MPPCAVYLIACDGGRTYTGISADPRQRYLMHQAGKASFFTKLNAPTALLAEIWLEDRRSAAVIERALKRRSQAERFAWFRFMQKCDCRFAHSLTTALNQLSRCDSHP